MWAVATEAGGERTTFKVEGLGTKRRGKALESPVHTREPRVNLGRLNIEESGMSPPGKRLRHFEEGIDGSRTPGLGRWSPENMQVVGRRGWRCEQEERLRVLAPSSCPLHPSSGRGGLGERPCSGSKLPTSGGSEGSLSPGLRGTQDGLRRARGKLLCPCLGGGSEQPRAPLVLPSRVLLSWLLWRERGDEHCCSGNTVLQLQRHQLLPRGKYCGRDSWAYQSRSNSGRALGVPVFPGIARESPPCSTGHGLPPQPLWAGLGWAGLEAQSVASSLQGWAAPG